MRRPSFACTWFKLLLFLCKGLQDTHITWTMQQNAELACLDGAPAMLFFLRGVHHLHVPGLNIVLCSVVMGAFEGVGKGTCIYLTRVCGEGGQRV
jgi:hypothetical protein